jgi:phage shock protein PspC (stress-responsive transcriptional regulator)
LLRRSDSSRVAAGVAGGLGEYFAVDPVLFRVLFAVTSFFGGAGILAYVIAWAAIPVRGAAQAPIDRLVGGGRRGRIPMWIIAIAATIVVWSLFFSWWAPWRFLPWGFLPLTLTVVVLAVALSRRPPQADGTAIDPDPGGPTTAPLPYGPPAPSGPPAWLLAARRRHQRSRPVRWATFGALVLALSVTALLDAVWGVAVPAYFFVINATLLVGLVVGAALRRPFWLAALFLIPGAIGSFVFAGCRVSLHDGSGDNHYTPHAAAQLKDNYRDAFGRTTLDLTDLPRPTVARTVHVRLAAGQVQLVIPTSLPVNVHADVHLGEITVYGSQDSNGMGLHSDPVTTSSPQALTIYVQISAGALQIDHDP